MISENNIIHRLTHWAFSLGMVWVLVMMILTAFDVGLRYTFSSPLPGTLELSEIMLALFGMLGMAYTEKMDANVKVEILEKVLPEKVIMIFKSITHLLSLSIILLLTWQSWVMGIEEYHYKTATDTLGVPLYPFHFLLSVASFILAVELFVKMVNSIHRLIKN